MMSMMMMIMRMMMMRNDDGDDDDDYIGIVECRYYDGSYDDVVDV